MQGLAYGGLSSDTRNLLRGLADGREPALKRKPRERLAVGTRLIRVYEGARVAALAKGCEIQWQGLLHPQRCVCQGRHWHGLERIHLFRPEKMRWLEGSVMSRKARSPFDASPAPAKKLRCAIYTRKSIEEKSIEEGPDQEYRGCIQSNFWRL